MINEKRSMMQNDDCHKGTLQEDKKSVTEVRTSF
jgi:hypothetical protein